MANELKERQDIEEKYKWDLTLFYKSDEAWEEAFQKLDEKISHIASFQGKLTSAEAIKEYLDAETDLSLDIYDIFGYANLRQSEDTRADVAQSMTARAMAKYVQIEAAVSFAKPEILSMDEKTLSAMVDDPILADHKITMQNFLRSKPHVLSAAEEAVIASLGEALSTGREASTMLMDADMVFDSVKDSSGEELELNESNYIPMQMSTDRILRENSFHAFYKSYREHINTFAATYNGNVRGATAEAKLRHYNSSREASLDQNHIPVQVYDNLVDTIHKHMPDMYRYLALRKRLLGVDELHYYDVYAPLMGESKKTYTFEQARDMVLETLSIMGEEYTDVVEQAFREHWIDVYPNKGKSGGAYSAGTYRSVPYILMNFNGSLDSVSTLAHEMGHSMHTHFSTVTQPAQYADYTLFVAEVASTVNENLLIEHLLETTEDPKERMALLNQYLENFKGTVYRQTMFAEFERDAHALAERGEALNATSLNKLYEGLIKEYFGDGLVLDEEVQYEWARIPHFYSPFYVYVYATGYSTAVALSEGIRKEGAPAVKRYIEFLSMGGSKDPLDELKHAGVDLTSPAPIDAALNKFADVLDQAEALADQLGL